MKKSSTALVASAATLVLTACGGGGGGGGNGFTNNGASEAAVGTSTTIATASAAFSDLNTGFEASAAQSVAQNTVPISGSTTYNGALGFDIAGATNPTDTTTVDASVVGDLELTTNFGDRNVTGSVTNIIYADTSGNVDGSTGDLAISGLQSNNQGIIQTTIRGEQQDVVAASLTGTLTVDQGGSSDASLQINAGIAGQFGSQEGTSSNASDIPEIVRGFVLGGPTTNNPNAVTIPNGRFVGETAGTGILP